MKLLPSKIMLHDLAPLCVQVRCTTCEHALSLCIEYLVDKHGTLMRRSTLLQPMLLASSGSTTFAEGLLFWCIEKHNNITLNNYDFNMVAYHLHLQSGLYMRCGNQEVWHLQVSALDNSDYNGMQLNVTCIQCFHMHLGVWMICTSSQYIKVEK